MPRTQHDPLTGLLTEPAFHRLASRAARHRRFARRTVACSHGDSDRAVGDLEGASGAAIAEAVIWASAERLVGCVRTQDRVAHAGDGHFRVLLYPWGAAEVAASLTEKRGHVLRLPVAIEGRRCELLASIGIMLCPHDRPTASAAIEHADGCMQRVADAGGGYAFSDTSLPASLSRGIELEADLREALRKGEFALHYQPRVSLQHEWVASAEALIRWTTRSTATSARGVYSERRIDRLHSRARGMGPRAGLHPGGAVAAALPQRHAGVRQCVGTSARGA